MKTKEDLLNRIASLENTKGVYGAFIECVPHKNNIEKEKHPKIIKIENEIKTLWEIIEVLDK